MCKQCNYSYARNAEKILMSYSNCTQKSTKIRAQMRCEGKIKLIWSNIPKKEEESVPENRRKRKH
jgi:activator of HSP90 ATPase